MGWMLRRKGRSMGRPDVGAGSFIDSLLVPDYHFHVIYPATAQVLWNLVASPAPTSQQTSSSRTDTRRQCCERNPISQPDSTQLARPLGPLEANA